MSSGSKRIQTTFRPLLITPKKAPRKIPPLPQSTPSGPATLTRKLAIMSKTFSAWSRIQNIPQCVELQRQLCSQSLAPLPKGRAMKALFMRPMRVPRMKISNSPCCASSGPRVMIWQRMRSMMPSTQGTRAIKMRLLLHLANWGVTKNYLSLLSF